MTARANDAAGNVGTSSVTSITSATDHPTPSPLPPPPPPPQAEYTALDPRYVASIMRQPLVIDARNALDSAAWKAAGFAYKGLGRA